MMVTQLRFGDLDVAICSCSQSSLPVCLKTTWVLASSVYFAMVFLINTDSFLSISLVLLRYRRGLPKGFRFHFSSVFLQAKIKIDMLMIVSLFLSSSIADRLKVGDLHF